MNIRSYNIIPVYWLTSTEIQIIQERTDNGDTAFQIRKDPLQPFGAISKNILYSQRKKILDKMSQKDIQNMQSELLKHPNWESHVFTTSSPIGNKFQCCYSYHMPVIESKYSSGVIIIDDTSCTNYYYLPLVALIAVDENSKNQVISFAIINNRTKESFIHYFTELKQKIQHVNAFVTDRNIAQIEALKAD